MLSIACRAPIGIQVFHSDFPFMAILAMVMMSYFSQNWAVAMYAESIRVEVRDVRYSFVCHAYLIIAHNVTSPF